jgi:hypothetical protein
MLTSCDNLNEVRPREADCGPIHSEEFVVENDVARHKEKRSV